MIGTDTDNDFRCLSVCLAPLAWSFHHAALFLLRTTHFSKALFAMAHCFNGLDGNNNTVTVLYTSTQDENILGVVPPVYEVCHTQSF